MHGLLRKTNLKSILTMSSKHTRPCITDHSNIMKGKIFVYFREKKYNETMQFLSYTYEKTSDLNNTHSWLGDKIVNHLKKINETVEEIHKKLKKLTDQALN